MSDSLPLSLPEDAPQRPLGGILVDRVLRGEERAAALDRAPGLPRLVVDMEAAVLLEMIATGVFSPLTGFVTEEEQRSILGSGRLLDGTPWPIPFCLAPGGRRNSEVLAGLAHGDEVLLADLEGRPLALLAVEQVFPYDRERSASELFGGADAEHPGVAAFRRRMGQTAVAGSIGLLQRPSWGPFERYRLTPADTFDLLYRRRSHRRVAGFVTGANPPHAGHEYMHRAVLETLDALLILPQVSMERPEYIKDAYRVAALEALLDAYYPPGSVLVGALRNSYLFAGPREAVLHALVMRNYGCTHALIGRDHAGVGDQYDMYASQRVFEQYGEDELGIETIFFSEVFYCSRCRATATEKTCAHDSRYRLQISGTGIREVLRRGLLPPKEICRPEVSHIALQGVTPGPYPAGGEGTDVPVYPAGQTIRSLFPFYQVAHRLGGHLRREPIPAAQMGERDLQAAILDARMHADDVYSQVYEEFADNIETNRSLAKRWQSEARELLLDHQTELAARLGSEGQRATEALRAEERLAEYPRPVYPLEAPPPVRPAHQSEKDEEGGETIDEWELPT